MNLWDQLIGEGDMIGEELLGASIRNAYCLDIGPCMFSLPIEIDIAVSVPTNDFSVITDTFPPLTFKSLFVEFDAFDAGYLEKNELRIGLHFVNWMICEKPLRQFSGMNPIKKRKFEEIYVAVFYFQSLGEIHPAHLCARIGLGKKGRVNFLEFVPIFPSRPIPLVDRLPKMERLLHYFLHLTMSAFSQINSQNFALYRVGLKKFIALERERGVNSC